MTEPRAVGDVVAERIRRYRRERGMSVRQLADECERLGAPQLTQASLANIERGQSEDAKRKRRDVTVEELLVLGYALAVPPLLLVVPLGENTPLQLTRTAAIHPHLAWKVITGDTHLVVTNRRATRLKEWHQAALPIGLFRDLQAAQQAFTQADTQLRFAEETGNTEQIEEARGRYANALRPFAHAVEALHRSGLQAPEYAPSVVQALVGSGFLSQPDLLTSFVEDEDGGDDGC
jgi:transcriptional regulator with XRE-family HTH domain